jgi:hypothetical protein
MAQTNTEKLSDYIFNHTRKAIFDHYNVNYFDIPSGLRCDKKELKNIFVTNNIELITAVFENTYDPGKPIIFEKFIDYACSYSQIQTIQCLRSFCPTKILNKSHLILVLERDDDNMEVLDYIWNHMASHYHNLYDQLLVAASNDNIKMFHYLYLKIVKNDEDLKNILHLSLTQCVTKAIDYLFNDGRITGKMLLSQMTNIKLSRNLIKIITNHVDDGHLILTSEEINELNYLVETNYSVSASQYIDSIKIEINN